MFQNVIEDQHKGIEGVRSIIGEWAVRWVLAPNIPELQLASCLGA